MLVVSRQKLFTKTSAQSLYKGLDTPARPLPLLHRRANYASPQSQSSLSRFRIGGVIAGNFLSSTPLNFVARNFVAT
jgi:hypothetical protein